METSNPRPALLSVSLALALCTSSCAARAVPASPAPAGDEGFGLPERGDRARSCEATAPLCWAREQDVESVHALLAAQGSLWLGLGDRGDVQAALYALHRLAHKLDEEQLAAFDELLERYDPEAELAPEAQLALAREIDERVAPTLLAGYFAAHAVPLGRGAALDGEPDDDGIGRATEELDDGPRDDGGTTELAADMRRSLDRLAETGALGRVYAWLLETTGVLRELPRATDPDAFPPSRSVAARTEELLQRYRWASAGHAVAGDVVALVPYAGTALSVPYALIAQLRLRARMVLELAALHGIDVREGDGLLVVALVLGDAMALDDTRELTAALAGVHLLGRAAAAVGASARLEPALRAAMLGAVSRLLERWSVRGAEVLARAEARAAAEATGRTVLGYATLGLAVVADAALTAHQTDVVGRAADLLLRPWGTGMLRDPGSAVREPGARTCASRVLGRLAGADSVVTAGERRLLEAHLSRLVLDGETWRPMVADRDVAELAAEVGAAASTPAHLADCVDLHLARLADEARLELWSWFTTMALVDGRLAGDEPRLLDDLADLLYLDRLDADVVAAVTRKLHATFAPEPELALALQAELPAEELIVGIDEVREDVRAALGCTLDGGCR